MFKIYIMKDIPFLTRMVEQSKGALIMEVVIGLIILLFFIFGIGYIFRRNIYKEIDRLEAWKIEIMNKSIIDEFTKVKELKMTGQTEKMFERWRNDWDEIITGQLPEVEELLFEAEEYADKYRFQKSKNTLLHIESILKEVEKQIDSIIEEINELVSSKQKNSVESKEAKEQFKQLKKTLITHGHVFGKAQKKLEGELDEIANSMKQFDEETDSGNYLKARDILTEQKSQLNLLQMKLENIPKLLSEIHSIIPGELQELQQGYKEMKEKGYFLSHIELDQELERIHNSLTRYKDQLDQANIDGVRAGLDEIHETIEELYDLLEKEVYASQFVKTEIATFGEKLNDLLVKKKETKEETDLVKQSYQLSEQDIEKLREIDKRLNLLEKQYQQIVSELEQSHIAHTVLKEELEELNRQLEETKAQHENYRQMLYTLRKDELKAREQVNDLKRVMQDIKRSIQKSNIPGLPVQFMEKVQAAQDSLDKIVLKLEEVPLNMSAVQQDLEDAVRVIENLKDETEEMIEQVYLVEKVIQYGNRYRSSHKLLARKLNEAEELFRNYEYGKSLEEAAAAIEEIEPGAIEKIQAIITEELKEKQ